MRVFDFAHETEPPDAEELEHRPVESEWQLESWLLANPEVILDERLLIFGRQHNLDSGVPDLLALDQWANVVVVEIKKGQSGTGSASEGSILSQPQEYAQSLSGYAYDELDAVYEKLKTKVRNDEWNPGEAGIIAESLAKAHNMRFGIEIDESAYNENQRMIILAEQITQQTEENARYLLDQGLNVQCVTIQQFESSAGESQPLDDRHTTLCAVTNVDYPLSSVESEEVSIDYSDLIMAVRERVFPEVREDLHLERPQEIATPTTKREIDFGSNNPQHPEPLKYGMKPQIEEQGIVRFRVNLWKAEPAQQEELRHFLASHTESLDGYTLADNPDRSMGVLTKDIEVDRIEVDALEQVDRIEVDARELANELLDLIEYIHTRAVEEYADHELFN